MLVACRLAGLSALGAHYANLQRARNLWRAAACANGDITLQLGELGAAQHSGQSRRRRTLKLLLRVHCRARTA